MKNKIVLNSLRTIKKSFSRFIPLFFMSFLGVFVFAGLQSLKPDMLITLDNYLDDHNIYDIKIVSTLGLTDDDLNSLKNVANIKSVSGSFSKDFIVKDEDEDIIINVETVPKDINKLTLLSGRLPQSKKEIVLEDNFIKKTNYKLNDKILIENEEYEIVGTVDSALYFNNDELKQERGTTNIGSGTINYYSYVIKDNFDVDYFTAIYVTVEDAKGKITSEEDYLELVDDVYKSIEKIKLEQENKRYDFIYTKAEKELKTNELRLNKELKNAKNKLDQALIKLTEAKIDLDSLNEGIALYNSNLEIFKSTLDEALYKYNKALIDNNIKEDSIEDAIKKIELLLTQIPSSSYDYVEYEAKLDNLKELQKNKELINEQIFKYEQEKLKCDAMKEAYDKGNNEYIKGKKEYENSLKIYNKNKENGLEKINEAKEELKQIKKPTWIINARENHETYTSYIDDINSVDNLAKVFPLIFFAVAVMVSLISMNRMVEEDRGEIGTLKSLGFSSGKIIAKYILFSSIATFIGGLIGGILGIIILPNIVFNIYGMLFNVPNFYTCMDFKIIIVSIIISVICICGSTIITALKVLKEKPSDLIRPKAPKNGRKTILENVNFIWGRINFSNKIFLRNILRYKKRALVAILGIAGCSALLLCGFGIRDAIVDIANMQYKETFKYDAMLYLNDPTTIDFDGIEDVVEVQNINIKSNNISANLMIVSDDIEKVVNLTDKDGNKIKIEKEKAIVTSKFARLNNLDIGDIVEFVDDNNEIYSYEISGIANNYLMHYVYITKDDYKPNVMLLNLNDNINKDDLRSNLSENKNILSIMYIEDLLKSADDMLKSLNKVVFIVIVLAASLSFIVLYNLSTINIDERKREISTLKVLGFYDKEVDNYVTKENMIFTIIGILLGLVFGYFLTSAVITTVEIQKASFIHHISVYSYILTSVITIIFTLIVNFVMHYKLRKVDMISSLKSVD